IEEEVVPVVVEHCCCSGQVFVDVCSRCEVFYKKVERSILEQSARGWLEELMQLVPANISTKLPGVITVGVRDVVLKLISVSHLVLRQIHAKPNRRARWTSIE